MFMADVVRSLGRGGQRFAESELGWNRKTIRKGQQERASGEPREDRFSERGRKKVEEHHPLLLDHIREIVEPNSQTDPTFRSTRIYTPLSAEEVRRRLHSQFDYALGELPCVRTMRTKLNDLGFGLKKVRKCRPLKRIPETDAIFEQVHQVNEQADEQEGVLRISLDTKAKVKVGPFSRGGRSRQAQQACDHDFQPSTSLTPFGILLPHNGESHLWFSEGKVTCDFMVDRIEERLCGWKKRFDLHTLVINADNGPESNGQRTQWLKRLVELADAHQLTIQLAYYPPYHSKYNPVERFWGVLENHWCGEIIDSTDKALGLARSMTYRGIKPTVRKVAKAYRAGVSVAKKAMRDIEQRLSRKVGLEPWFITIKPEAQMG
jgi:hypothetical protein